MSIKEVKSPLRAGVSATVGNARESESDAKILLQAKTIAKIDDVIEVSGVKLRISARELAYDVRGRIDHCKISCDYWSGA